jgi:hypothetical protein
VLGHNLRDAIPGRDFRRHLCDRLHRRGRLVHGRGGAVLVRERRRQPGHDALLRTRVERGQQLVRDLHRLEFSESHAFSTFNVAARKQRHRKARREKL